jgi:hypothetical protein
MVLVSFSQAFTIHKHTHFARLEGRPFLVGGQRGGDDHGDLVLGVVQKKSTRMSSSHSWACEKGWRRSM